MNELLKILRALEESGSGEAALATLVSVEGSSYRRVGARMLWRADETRVGGISGGCLEEDLAAHCREVAASGVSRVVSYDTRDENDLVWGVGTGCNGVVRVLVEPVRGVPSALLAVRDAWARRETAELRMSLPGEAGEYFEFLPPPVSLVIFGGGDDTVPLVRMARELGWLAAVRDSHTAGTLVADVRMAIVVMTHRFAHDVELLRELLPVADAFAYVGLLGPRARTEKVLAEIERSGLQVSAAMRARLHAPVGLDLGGDTPEAVALSVLAEIQCALAGRSGGPLRERKGAIHNG